MDDKTATTNCSEVIEGEELNKFSSIPKVISKIILWFNSIFFSFHEVSKLLFSYSASKSFMIIRYYYFFMKNWYFYYLFTNLVKFTLWLSNKIKKDYIHLNLLLQINYSY